MLHACACACAGVGHACAQVHLLIDEFIEQHLPSFSLRVENELAPAAFNLLRTATKKLKGEGRVAAYKALGRAEEAFYERIKVTHTRTHAHVPTARLLRCADVHLHAPGIHRWRTWPVSRRHGPSFRGNMALLSPSRRQSDRMECFCRIRVRGQSACFQALRKTPRAQQRPSRPSPPSCSRVSFDAAACPQH
jgi:hypothetical protein